MFLECRVNEEVFANFFQKKRVHLKINNHILFCFLNIGELSRSHGKSIEIGEMCEALFI